jgi:hypothetical protein
MLMGTSRWSRLMFSKYPVDLLGLVFLGPAEHQMLAQMRESGLAGLFVARPNLVKDVEGRDRRLMILQHQHLEPVGQRLGFDVIGNTGAGSARECDRNGDCERTSQCGRGFDPKIVKHGDVID